MTINSAIFGYPVRHKRKVPFVPAIQPGPEIAALNREIFTLEAELNRYLLTANDYWELIKEAFDSNIHISTHLEGNPLTKKDVSRLTAGVLRHGIPDDDSDGILHDFPAQEVFNHLLSYLSGDFVPPWSINHISRIHEVLMRGSREEAGSFRDYRAVVESSDGQELFIPAPHESIEEELNALLHWLNSTGSSMFPVIAGALFFHEFESIHPFGDGNGRCGRSLFHIYLQNHGLPNSRLCLIEQNIVAESEQYYDLLARTDHTGDYDALIAHFTRAVHASYTDAVRNFREKDLLSSDLDERAKRLLVRSKELNRWFKLEHARDWLDRGASDYVLRKNLKSLVERGALEERGQTKRKEYRFNDPLRRLKEQVRDMERR